MAKQKNQIGFTLIEFLVAIAIIAILMAILMPALQRVTNEATTCNEEKRRAPGFQS